MVLYLLKMKKIIHECGRVLNEGRFFVLNVSPVLIRRASRSEASRRIAVPFDFHRLFIEEGFEFIDDIIWVKPEGAGWATGRGRRFAADRNPLQYKPVPVTEYVLVYRNPRTNNIQVFFSFHNGTNGLEGNIINSMRECLELIENINKHPDIEWVTVLDTYFDTCDDVYSWWVTFTIKED